MNGQQEKNAKNAKNAQNAENGEIKKKLQEKV